MKTSFSFIAVALLFCAQAGAQVFSFRDAKDQALYQALLREFPVEVQGFDRTKESPEVIKAFTEDWNAFAAGKKPLPKTWLSNYSWSATLTEYLKETPAPHNARFQDNTENVAVAIDSKAAHSIEDAVHYSEERVGGEIIKALHQNRVSTIVYGGTKESVANALKIDGSQLKYLPSPYEAWGIFKALIPSTATSDGNPRYLMLIPPSRQYVIHYAKIFKYLRMPVEKALLNHSDQRRQVARLKAEFQRVASRLPAPVDVLSLGYYSVLQQNNDGLRPLTPEIPMSDGLTVQMLEETRVPSTPVRYLIVKSDLAIWGESSSLLVESALSLKPKAVIFMGSAGGIRNTTRHYDISVPDTFLIGDRRVDIKNEVLEAMTQVMGPWKHTVAPMTHGHTNSPIEQTKAYVEKRVAKQVDSYDVEQNLIADTIAEYNKTTSQKVSFIALNLITDKPKSFTHDWKSDHDLSRVNKELKADARQRAVNLALLSVRASPTIAKSLSTVTCDRAFSP